MAKFNYNFIIGASSEKEALVKMEALKMLASRLTMKELHKLADIVENDAKTLAMAKELMGV